MSTMAIDWTIIAPAFAAGVLVSLTHAPLGIQVLQRGIVFIDLAIAQIAGLGVVVADWLGFEPRGVAVQISALAAALAGAVILHWTERRWPDVQEAVIGVSFILAANLALLLLAANPHGAEHMKDLLIGQMLWVDSARLLPVAIATLALLWVWFAWGARIGRVGFYLVFACAVTISVQLVGLYVVFATLIVPALATQNVMRARLAACYALCAIGYALGLGLSLTADLPPGPLVVCTMTVLGAMLFAIPARSHGLK